MLMVLIRLLFVVVDDSCPILDVDGSGSIVVVDGSGSILDVDGIVNY